MDFASLKDQVSNLTLYDLKAGVRKVQNAVMNFTEMEAKVREATNNEPWGASSSLMQEIASATYNYQLLNEIMPMIYKRFTEKAAEEWRQIYKALQLLEFLIKNGSERVVDDARSHISLLKMLRQFHYIDQNGKDQGINVRNRSKELTELLSDVERIRAERKKARSTRNKYGGVEGGSGFGLGGSSGGSRYGGFGSEEGGYGGYSGGVYGDGGGFGGNQSGFSDTQSRRDRFEEYDEYDEGAHPSSHRRNDSNPPATTTTSSAKREAPPKAEPPKPKAPEVDLFSFDDPAPAISAPAAAPVSQGKQPAASNDFGAFQSTTNDDDDFDDFQSATPAPAAAPAAIPGPFSTSTTSSSTQFAAPQPRSAAQNANITGLFATTSPPPNTGAYNSSGFSAPAAAQPQQFQAQRPTGYQPSQPNYFTSVPLAASSGPTSSTSTPGSILSPGIGGNKAGSSIGGAKPKGGDAFSDLLSGTSFGKPATPSAGKGATMADLAKQKASAGIWGAAPNASAGAARPGAGAGAKSGGNGLNDLLG